MLSSLSATLSVVPWELIGKLALAVLDVLL